MLRCLLLLAFLVGSVTRLQAQSTDAAQTAALRAQLAKLSTKLETDPRDVEALARRAQVHAALRDPRSAIADFDRLLEIDPKLAAVYDARGSEQFKLGNIDASIADFDRSLALQPDQEPWHWKRGISYYYAGRWDEGRRQFEGYQSVDDNDVENAVWRFLCMAGAGDLEAARKDLLRIKRDPRIPMTEIYRLFAGELEPDDVLAAAEVGSPSAEELNARRFYAHLYLGLYHEVAGDGAAARRHLELARQHKIGHYMWDVADVHVRRLAETPQPAAE